jgi:hypothetical protein
MNRTILATSLFVEATALSSAGCYVDAQAEPPVAEGEVVAEAPPPPPPAAEVEVVPVAPAPDYYWVGGYHRWYRGRYVWVRGRYYRRPYAAARWYPAHWEMRGRGHVWIEGRWR